MRLLDAFTTGLHRIPRWHVGYLLQGPRVAVRRIDRQDYAELNVLQRESADMLRRWVGAREMTVEPFEGSTSYASTTGRGYTTEGLGLVLQFASVSWNCTGRRRTSSRTTRRR